MNGDVLILNDDIGCTQSGDIDIYTNEDDAILQEAIENMRIRVGSMPMALSRGNMVCNRRLKFTDNDMKVIESDCRDAIMYDTRIKSIPSLVATRMGDGTASIQFTVTKYDGTVISGFTKIVLMGGN